MSADGACASGFGGGAAKGSGCAGAAATSILGTSSAMFLAGPTAGLKASFGSALAQPIRRANLLNNMDSIRTLSDMQSGP
jgi:hypothetical protein